MTFQRVILSPEQLRSYVPALPSMKPHPLQDVLDKTLGTGHVTGEYAYAFAVDLMGIEQAHSFVKNTPAILNVWVNLLETYGWGNHTRTQDLQVNFYLNAIKATVNVEQAKGVVNGLKREDAAFKLIQQVADVDINLERALTASLLLNKGLDLPWTIITNVPQDGVSFGVFELPKQ